MFYCVVLDIFIYDRYKRKNHCQTTNDNKIIG